MSELEEAIKLFGREDLLGGYGIQDTDTNIEVFMSIKDMVKYYRQDLEIERLNNIINKIISIIYNSIEYNALTKVALIRESLQGSDKNERTY